VKLQPTLVDGKVHHVLFKSSSNAAEPAESTSRPALQRDTSQSGKGGSVRDMRSSFLERVSKESADVDISN